MAWHIFPTQNSIGTMNSLATRIAGAERNFIRWAKELHKSPIASFVVENMAVSSPANNTIRITNGYAIVEGFLVYNDANVDITGLSNSSTYIVFATLNYDGSSLASSITPNATTGAVPANSVVLGRVVFNGSGVADVADSALLAPHPRAATYLGKGAPNPQTVFCGYTPSLVIVYGHDATLPSGTATPIYSFSSLESGSTKRGLVNFPSQAIDNVSNTQRPEITTYGFIVGRNATPGEEYLNVDAKTYTFIAFP